MISFYPVFAKYKDLDFKKLFESVSPGDVERVITKEALEIPQLIALLSPAAEEVLEELAQKAYDIRLRNFGKIVNLYTPIYLSNYCDNQCVYCGFNSKSEIERRRLTQEEVEAESKFISSTGLRGVLILTGESREESPVEYIKDCVKILRRYFTSISIEVYPLTEDEYASLVSEGVDGLTIYQEVYDEDIYAAVHPRGPKRDYLFRLDAPERGAGADMRSINIGVLLGLDDWRKEIFLMALHARYLQNKFPAAEIGVSIPRLKAFLGDFKPPHNVSKKNIAQAIIALRIFLPRSNIALSTREDPIFREDLIPLGITRMSAGSTTRVGGRTINARNEDNPAQ
ncbi:MAG: 2-iminoacetate synthase ThiH, partial [Candidatus Omnitrophota bacterium]|nr:2-iminoacetate synthase ThiH [Candidatus Omnitrophota bacterium]